MNELNDIYVALIDPDEPNLFKIEHTPDLVEWALKQPAGTHYLQVRSHPQLMSKVVVDQNNTAYLTLLSGEVTHAYAVDMSESSKLGFAW